MQNLTIRKATVADASFIAVSILDAVGITEYEDSFIDGVVELCSREDTLYSWKNTLVAMKGDKAVGSITAYEGDRYAEMREITFELVYRNSGKDFRNMDMETLPGEYYLDSLSVRLDFRRNGIGRALLLASIDEACKKGIDMQTLACDPHNTKARILYESLGFRHESEMFIFDENYLKMVRRGLK